MYLTTKRQMISLSGWHSVARWDNAATSLMGCYHGRRDRVCELLNIVLIQIECVPGALYTLNL